MTAADQATWRHHHPLYILAISTAITAVIISLVVLIRWWLSRAAWQYHPGGAKGFLKDEFARWGVAIGPIILVGLFLKYYIYAYRPDLDNTTTWMIYGLSMVTIRMVVRRLPYVKAVARHIDAARDKARAAKLGQQP